MNLSTSGSAFCLSSPSSNMPASDASDFCCTTLCPSKVDVCVFDVLESTSTRRLFGFCCCPVSPLRRCALPDFPSGSQFSLSESPEDDRVKFLPLYCNRARLDEARPSFGFLPCLDSTFGTGAFRLLILDFKLLLLVDRSRLIAATAEPLDSFSACVVSSSLASVSQQNSQVRESRERPLLSRGTAGKLDNRCATWTKGRAAL